MSRPRGLHCRPRAGQMLRIEGDVEEVPEDVLRSRGVRVAPRLFVLGRVRRAPEVRPEEVPVLPELRVVEHLRKHGERVLVTRTPVITLKIV